MSAHEFLITSAYEVLPGRVRDFDENVIKNEPMLFNCDLDHSQEMGGVITREILASIPDEWKRVPLVVDSRVHMLMPGWYPCIPGWHHDDVPRTRSDEQPNYHAGQDRSEHIVCLINGDICPTAFATGTASFSEPPIGSTVYAQWHRTVQLMVDGGVLSFTQPPTNRLVMFNDRTWHTGTRAVKRGWRFFLRVSRYTDREGCPIARRNERTNETRRQVQVYLENPNGGW